MSLPWVRSFGVHVCVSNITELSIFKNGLRVRVDDMGTLTTWLYNPQFDEVRWLRTSSKCGLYSFWSFGGHWAHSESV